MNIDPDTLKAMGDFVPTSTKEALFNPAANAIGRGLGGIFTWLFQEPIKFGIIKEQEFSDLANKTSIKLDKIPVENRVDSKWGLAIKTLESSRYSLDSEELRNWFSTLLTNTIDNRVNAEVSPVFPLVLSALSPSDAQFLTLFRMVHTIPILTLNLVDSNNSNALTPLTSSITDQAYPSKEHSYFEAESSLNLLSSFGIIESTISLGGAELAADEARSVYSDITQSNLYTKLLKDSNISPHQVKELKGYARLTGLGRSFVNVAMPK